MGLQLPPTTMKQNILDEHSGLRSRTFRTSWPHSGHCASTSSVPSVAPFSSCNPTAASIGGKALQKYLLLFVVTSNVMHYYWTASIPTEVRLLTNVTCHKSNVLCNVITWYSDDKSNGATNVLLWVIYIITELTIKNYNVFNLQ